MTSLYEGVGCAASAKRYDFGSMILRPRYIPVV